MRNFNTREAVHYLKGLGIPFSENTFNLWRSIGRGPRFKKVGRKVFYEKESLDNFAKGVNV